MTFGYWRYYEEPRDWGPDSHLAPTAEEGAARLMRAGLEPREAHELLRSGYVALEVPGSTSDDVIVIDRYYGGAINRADGRTRFTPEQIRHLGSEQGSRIWVDRARCWEDISRIVDRRGRVGEEYLFRGQTQNYSLNRPRPNPNFATADLGEISLVPSFWRPIAQGLEHRFPEFTSLSLFEWSSLFYSAFDLEEIRRRHERLNDAGEYVITIGDMMDCSDEVLRDFGMYRNDLSMGLNYDHYMKLQTLLQHYGLLSPVLDLTSSLEVAVFFASHRWDRDDRGARYTYVGTNEGRSVVYVFKRTKESSGHNAADPLLARLDPQRPQRQHCHICMTGPLCVNLPADLLHGVILLEFEAADYTGPGQAWLFPGEDEDRFLRALKFNSFARRHVADFF